MLPHPILFNGICLLFALGGFYLLASASKAPRRAVRILARAVSVLLFLFAAALTAVGHPGLLDARFRPWLGLYGDLKPGMTRSEIDAAIAHHYPVPDSTIPRPRLAVETADSLVFLMSPGPSGSPDCEGIVLSLRDGRLLEKTYSPD